MKCLRRRQRKRYCRPWTPLHLSARVGGVYSTLALLQAGYDEHAVRRRRRPGTNKFPYAPTATPLVDAVSRKRFDVAKCLLRFRSRSVAASEYQALQEAVRTGSLPLVRLLLAHKVSPNWHTHVSYNDDDDDNDSNWLERWRGLVPFGATPLYHAANSLSHGAKPAACIALLLEAKACVNARNHIGYSTPLHAAAASGNTQTLHALLEARADVHATDARGLTAAAVAAALGQYSVLTTLAPLTLARLARPNLAPLTLAHPTLAPDDVEPLASKLNQPTCLHAAVMNQQKHCVNAVLQAMATQHRSARRAAVHAALCAHGRRQAGSALQAGSSPESEPTAKNQHEHMNRHEHKNQHNALGIRIPREVWIRIACMVGPHPMLEARDPQGNTALMLATVATYPALVKRLLEARADPCARNFEGDTPLAVAERVFRSPAIPFSSHLGDEHVLRAKAKKCSALLMDARVRFFAEQQNPTRLF